ncbi:MAG: hypothetical protein GX542_04380 [Rhodococcus sp.]|nr:hypothetical protein [Rhodococcus sp. (in: high G+C Gram-positive bacteria)]
MTPSASHSSRDDQHHRGHLLSAAPRCEPPLHGLSDTAPALGDAPTPGTEPPNQPRHPSYRGASLSPHDGRSPATSPRYRRPPRDGQQFAELAIRRALEVLDRRRSPDHLRALCAPDVIEHVHHLSATRGGGVSTSVPQTLHLQRADSAQDPAATAAIPEPEVIEFFGTYTHGGRRPAFAGQMARTQGRWQVTSLMFV